MSIPTFTYGQFLLSDPVAQVAPVSHKALFHCKSFLKDERPAHTCPQEDKVVQICGCPSKDSRAELHDATSRDVLKHTDH